MDHEHAAFSKVHNQVKYVDGFIQVMFINKLEQVIQGTIGSRSSNPSTRQKKNTFIFINFCSLQYFNVFKPLYLASTKGMKRTMILTHRQENKSNLQWTTTGPFMSGGLMWFLTFLMKSIMTSFWTLAEKSFHWRKWKCFIERVVSP